MLSRSAVIIWTLLLFSGCGPDPYAEGRKHAAEQIEQVLLGYESSLICPPLDLLETAANDPRLSTNLRELTLSGDFDRYSNVPLASFARLERVTLVDTKDTPSYLKVLPPSIDTLILDRTDLTSGTGASQKLNSREFTKSWLQTLTRFESLEMLFLNPWDRRLTPVATEVLPALNELKKLDIEWANPDDASALQNAMPNCRVKLVTEH